MINLLLADDQDLIREGLRMIIDADPELAVIGEARNGVEAITRTRELDPDVVLMDIRMPDARRHRGHAPTRHGRCPLPDRDADHLRPR